MAMAGRVLAGTLLLICSVQAQPRILASTIAEDGQFQALRSASLPAHDVVLHAWSARDTGLGLAEFEREIYVVVQSISDPDLRTPAVRVTEMGGIGDSRYSADAPAVVGLGDRFIIAWVGTEPGVSGQRIYARTLNAGSGGLGPVRRISEEATSPAGNLNDRRPTIACRSTQDTCLVVWERPQRSGDLLSIELMGRHVNAQGLPLGAEFQISAMGAAQGPDRYASLADVTHIAAQDRYIVAWEGRRAEADGQLHVYLSIVNGTSNSASLTMRATPDTDRQSSAAVQAVGNGPGFLFGWRPGLGSQIRVAPWDAFPPPTGAGQLVDLMAQPGNPGLIQADDGALLLHARTGLNDFSLWLTQLDADGRSLGEPALVLVPEDLPPGFRLTGRHEIHASSASRLRAVSLIVSDQNGPRVFHLISLDRDLAVSDAIFADGFE